MTAAVSVAILLLGFLTLAPEVEGQCPITATTISLGNEAGFTDRNNLDFVLEGNTTGGQATSTIWRRNGSMVSTGGGFFIGGGDTIQGSGPCESQLYRVAIGVNGYLPGFYTYTVTNAETPTPVTSSIFEIQDPGPPTNIILIQVSNRRVQATWTPPAGFPNATYRVYLNTAEVNIGGTSVTETTYTTDSLSTGFNAILRVRATTGTYFSVPAVSSFLLVRDVLAPILSVLSVTAESANLSFSQPENSLSANLYTITLSSTTCTEVPTRIESVTSNSTSIGNLEAGVVYSVNVFARNTIAELTGTQSTTLTTMETAPSGSPGSPTSSATTSTSITITWTEIACLDRNGVITGYTIRYGPVDTSPTTIDHASTDRNRQITGLSPFTNYTISVRGVNSVGPGDYSAESLIRSGEDRPTAVTDLSGTPMLFSVVLTWSEPVPLNGILDTYTIRYSVNNGNDMSSSTRATTFTITDLNPNTVVSNIRVRAATGAGEGPDATIADITTLHRPSAVLNIEVEVLDGSVRVHWNNSGFQGITDFVVYYRQIANGEREIQEVGVVVAASANSVIIRGLVSGEEYIFEVVARVTVGERSVSGPRAGPLTPLVLTTAQAMPSSSSTKITSANSRLSTPSIGIYFAIIIITVIVTVTLYSIILLIVILFYRRFKHKKGSSDIKLQNCAAYSNTTEITSSSVYETVKNDNPPYYT